MKKYVMSLLALVLGIGLAQANPVTQSQAKYVGQQFVQANFEPSRQSSELSLVYTGTSTRGEACFYVFNVGENGFVIVSADDYFRPILGYSKEGVFPIDNMPGGLSYLLNNIIEGRTGHSGIATPTVAAEWELVANTGQLMSKTGGREVPNLVLTKWNQDSPYNLYAPEHTSGPGGRCYAGCVATAMSQIMKYWNHPLQGTGSVTYTSSGPGYPTYPNLTANFGQTTYDWENMPLKLDETSTQTQIEAVATLMYHCGVAVHMKYAPDGSGANSEDVPTAIRTYFSYTNQSVLRDRAAFNHADWDNMLKEQLDMGWPVYYSGCDASTPIPGCHAFVCVGYDKAGLYHWNFGWGGSGDNVALDFDDIEYAASNDRCIVNFVPTDVYNGTPKAPTSLTVTPAANNELKATISWTNPSMTLNNTNLTSIDQIVVCRNGEVIYTEDNVTPGANMTITDNSVPRFDAFTYTVYAVCNGNHGKLVYSDLVNFGPTCGWTIIITQASFNGFRGGAIHMYNAAGTEFAYIQPTTSGAQSVNVEVPLGHVSFGWSAPTGAAFNMAFSIKNSQNVTVYTYSGNSADMPVGIFHEDNNTCGNSVGDGCPTNLVALIDEESPYNINVSWDAIPGAVGYGYTVYRDNLMYRVIPDGTSFVDEGVEMGGHCYKVSFLYDGGENGQYSNESCATAGTCYAPTDFTFEYNNSYRPKLKWTKPEPADGLSGYYIYRKKDVDGVYQRIKIATAGATSYTDNTLIEDGDYYYQIKAYYQDMDCYSAPAYWIKDHNQFYLHVYYSEDAVDEQNESGIAIFPNPTTSHFTVSGEGMNHIAVYNLVGQKVYEMECRGELVDINLGNAETGIYMVRISTDNGEVTQRITVIR